ncbi:MAG TPA: HAD family hydrolase [Blastocatellia bacterium]|nr:HAD family hydrolase [Blastocatellia bacterium]
MTTSVQTPSSIALVISDIDGTLITSNHEVSEATRTTAAMLYDRGIELSLASSRPPRSIVPLADALNLRGPFAAFNGALVVRRTGEVLARSVLSAGTIAGVKAIADQFGIGVWLYDEIDWWAPWRDGFVDREEHTSGFSPRIDGYAERINRQANKLTVVGRPELVARAEQRVLAELGDQVSASKSKPRFLDVTSLGIHKGTVVVRLARLLNIPTDRVAVIGDGPNDVEMFRQAGVSIAMGQGVDEVKEAATYLTSSNDDEGWARGIEQYVLGTYKSATS